MFGAFHSCRDAGMETHQNIRGANAGAVQLQTFQAVKTMFDDESRFHSRAEVEASCCSSHSRPGLTQLNPEPVVSAPRLADCRLLKCFVATRRQTSTFTAASVRFIPQLINVSGRLALVQQPEDRMWR